MTAKICCSRRTISVVMRNSDAQGRVLVPRRMRKAMKIENQPVWLEHQKGHIKLFGAASISGTQAARGREPGGQAEGVRTEGAAVALMYARARHVARSAGVSGDRVPDGIYIDVTLGLGGHSKAIAERLTSGRLLSLDRDAESMELAGRTWRPWIPSRIEFRQARFSELAQRGCSGYPQVDGLIADLGVSRYQLTTAGSRLLVHECGAGRHADGSQQGYDCRRDCEHGRRTYVGQFDFRVRRREEVATNSQSNRSRAAHSGHCASCGSDRRGRSAQQVQSIRRREPSWLFGW